jgi:hypothetical protein
MRVWSTLSFISRADFIAYKGSTTRNSYLWGSSSAEATENCESKELSSEPEARTSSALQPNLLAPPVTDDGGHRYNARNSTREKTLETQAKQQQKSKGQKESKESKDAKAAEVLREKLRVLEEEKKLLKSTNSSLKSTRKVEIDAAVDAAVKKAVTKQELANNQLLKQLDQTQQNLVAANSKIQNLVSENSQLKTAPKATTVTQKSAAAITTVTSAANNIISTPTATTQLPTYYTPQNIAEEYKSLAKVIQGTETTIAIDKIQAEGSIALARLEEEKN